MLLLVFLGPLTLSTFRCRVLNYQSYPENLLTVLTKFYVYDEVFDRSNTNLCWKWTMITVNLYTWIWIQRLLKYWTNQIRKNAKADCMYASPLFYMATSGYQSCRVGNKNNRLHVLQYFTQISICWYKILVPWLVALIAKSY